MLLDHKNLDLAVGIAVLSCLQAQIYTIPCLLPVERRHVWFTTYPDVRDFTCPVPLLDHGNIDLAVGISLLYKLRCTYKNLHFQLRAAIFDLPATRLWRVFTLVLLCCCTTKMWGTPQEISVNYWNNFPLSHGTCFFDTNSVIWNVVSVIQGPSITSERINYTYNGDDKRKSTHCK